MGKFRIVLSLVVLIALISYVSSFITACNYTAPSPEEARIRVTNGLKIYYAIHQGSWTPFKYYHTVISGGYYSQDWFGVWRFHEEDLKLHGDVEEYIRYDWEER